MILGIQYHAQTEQIGEKCVNKSGRKFKIINFKTNFEG